MNPCGYFQLPDNETFTAIVDLEENLEVFIKISVVQWNTTPQRRAMHVITSKPMPDSPVLKAPATGANGRYRGYQELSFLWLCAT